MDTDVNSISNAKQLDILESTITAMIKILSHTWGLSISKKRTYIDAFFILTENSLYTQMESKGNTNFPFLAVRLNSVSTDLTSWNKVLVNKGMHYGYSEDGSIAYTIYLRPIEAALTALFIADDAAEIFNFYNNVLFNSKFSFKIGSNKSTISIVAQVDTSNLSMNNTSDESGFSSQIEVPIKLYTYVGYMKEDTVMTDFNFSLGIGSDILSSIITLKNVS